MIASVLAVVAESPDYARVRDAIDAWIAWTVRFLFIRSERAQPDGHYLRDWPQGQHPPHESRLADDYVEFLIAGDFPAHVYREVPLGGGRVDVFIEPAADIFIAEVKRELTDASNAALEAYALQEALYLRATVAIGMVMVLDLTPDDRPVDIRDEVWVTRVPARSGRSDRDRLVCIVRVRGNRRSPSDIGRDHVAASRRTRPPRDRRARQR